MPLYITLSHFRKEGIKKWTVVKVHATIYIAFLFSVTLKMKKMYLNIRLFKIVSSMRRFNPFVHF